MKEQWNIPEAQPLKNDVTEETLMSFSLEPLFDLMIEKINEIRLLNKSNAYEGQYSEIKREIMLIQKIIVLRKSENHVTH